MSTDGKSVEGYLIRYTFLATPYATIVALSYLIGYWGEFKINILSYITITDILKLALLPLILVLFFSTLLSFGISRLGRISGHRSFTLGSRSRLILTGLVLIVINVIGIIFVGFSLPILIFALLLGIFFILLRSFSLFERVGDPSMRLAVAALIVSPVFMSYQVGRGLASDLINTMPVHRLVDVKVIREFGSESFNKKHLLEGQEKLLFVGVANDYVFFMSLDKSKSYIFKFSDLHFLEFNNN